MAAPRVLQVRQRVLPLLPCLCGRIQFNQVRHKKGSGRLKAPSEAKDKEKWIPFAARKAAAEKVVTKEVDESFLARVPLDDVWLTEYYPALQLSFKEAIARHAELVASPDMLDMPNATIVMKAWLNMKTKKKTKFMSNITGSLIVPCNFDDGVVNRVIAFTKTDEEREEALECGAIAAGYVDLIRSVASGEIGPDDYDHAVCLYDFLPELSNLRKYLKERFPNKNRGSLGTDLTYMITQFKDGKGYASVKEDDAVAKIEVKLGTLDMGVKQLEDNFKTYVDTFNSHRSPDLGQFITRAVITCPPSPESFHLSNNLLAHKKKPKEKQTETSHHEEVNQEAVTL